MKRIIAFVLSVVILCSLAACAAPQSKPAANNNAADYSQVYAAVKKCRADTEIYGNYNGARDFETEEVKAAASDDAFSQTNVQVEGVDEGDIVKTDGEYIYAVNGNGVVIYKAAGAESAKIGTIETPEDQYISELYICDKTLVLVENKYTMCYGMREDVKTDESSNDTEKTIAQFYDVSDPSAPKLRETVGQDGWQLSCRLYDGKLYLISTYTVWSEPDESKPETFVPSFYRDGESIVADCKSITIAPEGESASYIVVSSYDVASGNQLAQRSILGAGSLLYMNDRSLYLASPRFEETYSNERKEDVYTVSDYTSRMYTDITRVNVSDLTVAATGTVDGLLESQFSMDEYDGALRLVTTVDIDSYTVYKDEKHGFENWEPAEEGIKTTNSLYVLDGSLNEISSVKGLAEDERVYSVRFDGTFVYFCTFRQVDPLFAVDLSNPKAPKILSELKISGFSEYLHPWSDTRLFGLGNEADTDTGAVSGMKLVMFDISDKANVTAKHTLELDGTNYSEALYNHKALLVSPEKNVIGFGAESKYVIFSYSDEDGFKKCAESDLGEEWSSSRGMYVGDFLYIVSDFGMKVLSMQNFETVGTVEI